MQTIKAKSVCSGIAIGRLVFLAEEKKEVARVDISDTQQELKRFEKSRESALKQLQELYHQALEQVGEKDAEVFEIHQMMLEDDDFLDAIKDGISNLVCNAEYAVSLARDEFATSFAEMDDPYMKARSADVMDISGRLINCLSGKTDGAAIFSEPVVIAAQDLTPSQTIQLDKKNILAFVLSGGSTTSHTAILARTMDIPAIVGAGEGVCEKDNGRLVAVDGNEGILYLDPDEQTLGVMKQKYDQYQDYKQMLQQFKGKPNCTADGKEILVYANIGSVSELDLVKKYDAGGIGLFRSEFLYLQSSDYPDEDTQFAVYRKIAKELNGKRAIIRTLDIGADKQIDYFSLDHEENPALGLRGLRLCLERPELLKTQLRALLRASAYGNIAIMFPMVASVWEVEEAISILDTVKGEMRSKEVSFKEDIEVGIMIETPAAALISDQLAKLVDFFSIGTNDLTQYTLGIDRQNDKISRFNNPKHGAVLKLIKIVIDNAHAKNIWAGICGELAADTTLTQTFLDMDVDELSVTPPKVLELRKKIRECSIAR